MAKAVITDKAPKPKRRPKKRDEDTRGLFKKLAMKILRQAVRPIFHDSAFNRFAPPHKLDNTQRRMLRQWDNQSAAHHQHGNQAPRPAPSNHLSLRY